MDFKTDLEQKPERRGNQIYLPSFSDTYKQRRHRHRRTNVCKFQRPFLQKRWELAVIFLAAIIAFTAVAIVVIRIIGKSRKQISYSNMFS